MKRWLLRCICIVSALYFCAASAFAGETGKPPPPETRLSSECLEALEAALARMREAGVLREGDEANPEGVLRLASALILLHRFAGGPEVETRLPLNPDLPYYPALCWIYSQGWCGELGLDDLDKEGMQKLKRDPKAAEAFQKRFEEMTVHNQELVILISKLECDRAGLAALEIPETLPKYRDVKWDAPPKSKEANYLTPLRWTALHKLIDGILDEIIGDALYFHPSQEEIGKGICLRGQFFTVLYRYDLMIHPVETAPAVPADAA